MHHCRQKPPLWASLLGLGPVGHCGRGLLWAQVNSEFSIFSWIYSNRFQINFGLNLNLYKFVQTLYLNKFVASLGI
jgi:hypothetical protein